MSDDKIRRENRTDIAKQISFMEAELEKMSDKISTTNQEERLDMLYDIVWDFGNGIKYLLEYNLNIVDEIFEINQKQTETDTRLNNIQSKMKYD